MAHTEMRTVVYKARPNRIRSYANRRLWDVEDGYINSLILDL